MTIEQPEDVKIYAVAYIKEFGSSFIEVFEALLNSFSFHVYSKTLFLSEVLFNVSGEWFGVSLMLKRSNRKTCGMMMSV